jgi:hypothetical protein
MIGDSPSVCSILSAYRFNPCILDGIVIVALIFPVGEIIVGRLVMGNASKSNARCPTRRGVTRTLSEDYAAARERCGNCKRESTSGYSESFHADLHKCR